ncbi:putative flippase GtrA [Saccharopolyspora phatthalungensis]|uniref:Putative flippase GtrA n=1 Tax=Saccharopolyspora phatthalungensis TaxID=664693 RepID=A0A840Q3F3_9PSEU|nr:putative flippase GtrA [Saccharopolyspora phatthalungensis]
MADPAAETETKRLGVFNQLFRFIIIGGGCAIIDAGVYAILLSLGLPNWTSKAVSFILGTTASYLINRKFTFSGASTGNAKAKAVAFAAVYGVTFFVNVGTNQLLYVTLPDFNEQFRYAVCWVVAQGLGTLINFVMLKWVVFRD